MLSNRFVVALAAFALALTSTARANDDVLRLNVPSTSDDALTLKLVPADTDDADTLQAAIAYRGYAAFRGYYGGNGGYGGYRGYGSVAAYGAYGGYRPYGGYYGGSAQFYGSYNRYGYGGGYGGGSGQFYGSYSRYGRFGYGSGSVSGSWNRYGGYGYGGGGATLYGSYNRYGYGGGYGGYGGGYYTSDDGSEADTVLICSKKVVVQQMAPTVYTLPRYPVETQQQAQPDLHYYAPQAKPQETPRIMPRAEESATYPYDGGPSDPVPMPKAEAPSNKPTVIPYQRAFPNETFVSLPAKGGEKEETKSGKWNFPAYGEQATRSAK